MRNERKIKRVKRYIKRARYRVQELRSRKGSLSKFGYWDLGYYEGRLSVLEDILDDLLECS